MNVRALVKQLGAAFLRGLAAVLPIGLTLYLIFLFALWSEQVMGQALQVVLPSAYYLPGMGLVASLLVVVIAGYLVALPVINWPVRLGDALFSRVPLVKSVYSTVKDIVDFVTSARDSDEPGRTVLVEVTPDVFAIGLVTDSEPDLGGDAVASDKLLVYLPMSYQVGGYTLLLPKDRISHLDMSVEDAMRFVLTAGVRGKDTGERRGKT